MKNKYNIQNYKRKKQWFRLRYGAYHFFIHPIWNLTLIIPLLSLLVMCYLKELYIKSFTVVEILRPIFNGCLTFATIIVPILITVIILQGVGELSARRIESKIELCFDKKLIEEKGTPILVSKRRILHYWRYEFFSNLPKSEWDNKIHTIEDLLNIRIFKTEYGKRGDRIIFSVLKGRVSNFKGAIYDDEV